MRIRQIHMLPVRNSLHELLRTAITTLSPQASVNADYRTLDESFSILNLPCGILENFPRKFPHSISSVDRFRGRSLHKLPVMDGHGMVSPRQLTDRKEVKTE